MICFTVCGIRLRIAFTAPFLLGVLSLALPPEQIKQTLLACGLHEAAHLAAVYLTGQRPDCLTVSAAGMQLTVRRGTLCPLRAYTPILLSGPLMNLLTGVVCHLLGMHPAAVCNISLAAFNLLPFKGTDGGTLLRMLLTEKCTAHAAEAAHTARVFALCSAVMILLVMHFTDTVNLSLLAMTVYLSAAEFF